MKKMRNAAIALAAAAALTLSVSLPAYAWNSQSGGAVNCGSRDFGTRSYTDQAAKHEQWVSGGYATYTFTGYSTMTYKYYIPGYNSVTAWQIGSNGTWGPSAATFSCYN